MPHGAPGIIQELLQHSVTKMKKKVADPTGTSVDGPDPVNPGPSGDALDRELLGSRPFQRLDDILLGRVDPTGPGEARLARERMR